MSRGRLKVASVYNGFKMAVEKADATGLPYIAYWHSCGSGGGGYALYMLAEKTTKGVKPTPKATVRKIEADIKRLVRMWRLRDVVRCDGINKTESTY